MRAVLRLRLIRRFCLDEDASVPDTRLRPYHGMLGSGGRGHLVCGIARLRDLRMTGMTELTPCPYLASALDRNCPGLAFNWPLALSTSLCYCHRSPPDISRNAFRWNQNLGCHQRPFGHWLSPWGTRYRGATTRAARIKPRIGPSQFGRYRLKWELRHGVDNIDMHPHISDPPFPKILVPNPCLPNLTDCLLLVAARSYHH
ncbi:hypothetical protein FA13DRAFT_1136590 [Coprinellus micaceus]|uniref:Uncharacterized protein n=1 Tax=Coprinellus micaceus TaxID=71717 RepID=A0A4Y7RJA6_COPMI|nr:hypothetical protein FA13DRAFT_1136590 [Coprinellus micaceus]